MRMRNRKLPPGDVHIGARVKTELYQGLKIRAVLAEVPIRALLEEAVTDAQNGTVARRMTFGINPLLAQASPCRSCRGPRRRAR